MGKVTSAAILKVGQFSSGWLTFVRLKVSICKMELITSVYIAVLSGVL